MDTSNFDIKRFNIPPEKWERLCALDKNLKGKENFAKRHTKQQAILKECGVPYLQRHKVQRYIMATNGNYTEIELKEYDKGANRRTTAAITVMCLVVSFIVFRVVTAVPIDPCDCAEILNEREQYSTMYWSDEKFDMWKSCDRKYRSPGTAFEKCVDKVAAEQGIR